MVIRNLKKAGVQTRDFCEAQFVANGKEYNELLLDAEWLSYMHWSENKSCKEIGEILGYDAGTIRRQLNPNNVSDRLELYHIITKDKRFLDENNLITFCKDCHFYKIHNYNKTISSQASQEEGSETIQ